MKFLATVILASAFLYGCQESDTATTADDKDNGRLVFETGEIIFSEKTLKGVCYGNAGEGDLVAMVSMTEVGAEELFRLTSENIDGTMTLVSGEKEYFNATIRDPISGKTPIGMIYVSPKTEQLEEIKALFGLADIKNCED